MSDSENIRSLMGMTAFGAIIAYGGWKNVKRINRVKDSSKQLISAASAGQVELEAIAWPIDKVEKCIEGKSCVLLEIILEVYTGGKNGRWKEMWRFTHIKPFLAFDQSGFITINPEHDQEIDVHRDKIYYPHRMSSGQRLNFKSRYRSDDVFGGSSLFGINLGESYRIKEKKILLGSPVLIHGSFLPVDKINYVNLSTKLQDYRDRCIKLLKSESFRKRFFDRNKDGSITREELGQGFERVLQMSEGELTQNLPMTPTGEQHCRFYGIVSSNENGPLQLADTFEEQYLKTKSAFMAWISFSCGLFVFFVGLYLLAQYSGQR